MQAPISYVELDTLPDAYLSFNVEISFKPESPNGLILYNGQGNFSSIDIISIISAQVNFIKILGEWPLIPSTSCFCNSGRK